MVGDDEHWSEYPYDLSPRLLRAAVRRLCQSSGWQPSSDVLEDCVLETLLVLWRQRKELAGVPADKCAAYVARCAWFVVRECRRREHRQSLKALALEDLQQRKDGPPLEPVQDALDHLECIVPRTLLDCIGREDVLMALRQLPPGKRHILDLHFVDGLTDCEIARRLNAPTRRIQKQRQRALKDLIQLLGGGRRAGATQGHRLSEWRLSCLLLVPERS
jgi:RNA polymerase sigma factor (sigma-70 family)